MSTWLLLPKAVGNRAPSILKPGSKALKFTFKSTLDQFVSLRDLRGRPLVIAFYPAGWSLVCSHQMGLYAQIMPEFKNFDAGVVLSALEKLK
jgi:peroxiredoxin